MKRTHTLLTIFILVLFGLDAIGQPRSAPKKITPKGNYVHKGTQTTFPATLFDYQLTDISSFDKKDLNVGVTYEKLVGKEKTTFSVFLYPAGAGSEGRLREEYFSSMQSMANVTKGLHATQFHVKYTGPKYTCNGYKAIAKPSGKDLSQLTLYECGTWFLKLRISSNHLDSLKAVDLERQIISQFNPSRLTALKPLHPKPDVYFSEAAYNDSTMLGGSMGSAFKKIDWVLENVPEGERASGFPDLYLDLHKEAIKAMLKFEERGFSKSKSTAQYFKELNSIIAAGYLTEFILDQYGMVMIIPEGTTADFEGFNEWKKSNPISVDLNKRYYMLSYGDK